MTNVYTEEEAKKKMCCQAIHMLGMSPVVNCMAGSCMAWRDAIELSSNSEMRLVTTVIGGYCGLAGKP